MRDDALVPASLVRERTELQPQSDLVPLWLTRYDRPHTRRAYSRDVANFFATDTVTLDQAARITPMDVNAWIEQMEVDGLSAQTRRRRIAALRSFYRFLRSVGAARYNPADPQLVRRVPVVRRSEAGVIVLTKEQARRLLDAASLRSPRDGALVALLVFCCLRRSEAAAMKVEHVEAVGPYWRLKLPLTKGGADEWVKIPGVAMEYVQRHVAESGITEGHLFRSHSNNSMGEPLQDRSVYDIVRLSAKEAGLLEEQPKLGAHTMRHTGCTLAIEQGASLKQVQTHARHKQVETTMVYVHQRDRLRDSAADYIKF